MRIRRAYHDVDFFEQDGFQVGISLGYDYCAEHECDISGIKESFGISEPTRECMGLKARTATLVPNTLLFLEKKLKKTKNLPEAHYAVLAMDETAIQKQWDIEDRPTHFFKNIRHKPFVNNLYVEWGSTGFVIYVQKTENVGFLQQIHQAILAKDVCIGLGANSNPFARGGLNLLIPSRLDKSFDEKTTEGDKEYFRLDDACNEAGLPDLQARLQKAGKRWYAMGPSWNIFKDKDGNVKETKFPIICFLNPMDQAKYNFGWFTLEDFEDWIENKGKIIK